MRWRQRLTRSCAIRAPRSTAGASACRARARCARSPRTISLSMARATERWQFEWRRTWRDVWSPSFERIWHTLFETSGSAHVYHRPALVHAWADTCGQTVQADPMFGLARSTSGAELVLPWVIARQPGRLAVRRTLG